MQSVPISTKRCEFEPRPDEVYSIQHYVRKFVSDLRQVGGFLRVLRFPPPIKLNTTITEILLKVALNTITITSEEECFNSTVIMHLSAIVSE